MKKKFFPHSATWIIYLLFIVLLIGLSVSAFVVMMIREKYTILTLVLIPIAIIFLLYQFYIFIVSYIIYIDSDSIYSKGDKFSKIEKVQYKCIVNFNNIIDINIIASEKNSIDKPIQLSWTASAFKKKYFEFTLKDNKKYRICINHYTKKQVLKMLQNIQESMLKLGNNTLNIDHVMKNWYSYGNYPKIE